MIYLLLILDVVEVGDGRDVGRDVEGVDVASGRGGRHRLCELGFVIRGRVGRGDRHVVGRGKIC